MTFELGFLEEALKEWKKLDAKIQAHFKSKLQERLELPRVPSAKLKGHQHRYTIKLRPVGYRWVYEIRDNEFIIIVISVGRRERNAVWKNASHRGVQSLD